MSVLFKSITAASNCSLCPFISISKSTILVTFPFSILSALKTLNKKLIGFVWILLSLTNYLLVPICVHSETTSALTLRFFLFFVLMFAHMFNFFSALLHQLGIIYLFWEFTQISCTMSTQDLCQNPSGLFLCCLLYCPIPPEPFVSSSTAFLYSPSLYVLLCHIWNISSFPSLSYFNIPWPYGYTCCNWSTLTSCLWNCHWTFQYLLAVLFHYKLFWFLSCNCTVFLWTCIPVWLR